MELKERILPYLLRVRDQARIPIIYVTHQPGEARLLAQEALILPTGSGGAGLGRSVASPFTVPAEDLLLSTHSPHDISAPNVFAGKVAAAHEIGADVFLSIDSLGYEWVAKLTAGAVRELSIQRGSKVFVVVKTHSFRRLR